MIRSHPKICRRIASAQEACRARREEAGVSSVVRQRRATKSGASFGLALRGCASNAVGERFWDGF